MMAQAGGGEPRLGSRACLASSSARSVRPISAVMRARRERSDDGAREVALEPLQGLLELLWRVAVERVDAGVGAALDHRRAVIWVRKTASGSLPAIA